TNVVPEQRAKTGPRHKDVRLGLRSIHLHFFSRGHASCKDPNFGPCTMKNGISFSRAYGLSADLPTYSTLSNFCSRVSRSSSSTIKQLPLYPRGPHKYQV